jgi:hypothetical protein
MKQYLEEQRRREEERIELEKLKKQSLSKPLADYAPGNSGRKQTTI